MNTYSAAAVVLARSTDPEDRKLARATERFAAGLTDVTTERTVLAREVSAEQAADRSGLDPMRSEHPDHAHGRGASKETPDRGKGPDRER